MAFRNFFGWFGGKQEDDLQHIDPSKRYFRQVSGLENIKPEDMDAQKDLVIKAIPQWTDVSKDSLQVKNISGMGGSQTYMVICKGGAPERVIIHNKSPEMTDEQILTERRQERIVFELSKVDATPPRLCEGESWYVEPCAGTPMKFDALPIKKIADCSSRFHKASVEWYDDYRAHMVLKHKYLKDSDYGSIVWYFCNNAAFNCLLDNKDIMWAIRTYEPKPISEGGKRVVTCHGDWHTGNMLDRDDGSVIAIDLEMSFVGWASLDAAYFTQQAHLSRAQIMLYAEEYLRAAGLDTSQKSVREFVFDIEQARVFCMLVGLSTLEEALKAKGVGYKEGFVTDALELLDQAKKDSAKFDLVVDNGLFFAMFKNNSKAFAGLYEKFGSHCWYFNPDSNKEYVVFDQMNVLKEGQTPDSIYSEEMNTPELMKAGGVPLKCERVEKDHFFIEVVPNVPTLNVHMLNFEKDGNNFSYDVICGMKPEPPYKLFGYRANFSFKEFTDGTWAVRRFNNHYVQFAMAEDFRPTLVKSILEGVNDQFMKKSGSSIN